MGKHDVRDQWGDLRTKQYFKYKNSTRCIPYLDMAGRYRQIGKESNL